MAARGAAFKQLNDAYQARLSSLDDPLARNTFEDAGWRYLNNTISSLDDHYQQQQKAAFIGSAQATQDLALKGLSIYAKNDQQWQQHSRPGCRRYTRSRRPR